MKNDRFQQWDSLREYMVCIRHNINVWEDFFRTREIDWLSLEQLQEWLGRLKLTFNLLESLHTFDDLNTLSIGSQGSGFPRRRHLDALALEKRSLQYDCDAMQNAKRIFLDTLFSTRHLNMSMLENIAKAKAYQTLFTHDISLPFLFNGIEERMCDTHGRRAFVCFWERYTDIPIKYVMLFEVSDAWMPDGDDLQKLIQSLQEETSLITGMEGLARGIDMSDARVYPKWIGRVILGPVWISNVTQDRHQLQSVVDNVAQSDKMRSASRIIYEYILSKREVEMEQLRDAQGRRYTHVQKFAVRLDGEHYERGVTHLEKVLFAPHDVIQELDDAYRKEIGHQLFSTEVE